MMARVTRKNAHKLSILIVGKDQNLSKLGECIRWQKLKLDIKCEMVVDFCERTSDVLDAGNETDHDFVVLTFDMGRSNSLHEVRRNLSHLKKQLIMHSVCVVSIVDVPPRLRCVEHNDLHGQFKEEYSVPIIFGDINNSAKCNFLAERILILASSIIGLHSGIPILL